MKIETREIMNLTFKQWDSQNKNVTQARAQRDVIGSVELFHYFKVILDYLKVI